MESAVFFDKEDEDVMNAVKKKLKGQIKYADSGFCHLERKGCCFPKYHAKSFVLFKIKNTPSHKTLMVEALNGDKDELMNEVETYATNNIIDFIEVDVDVTDVSWYQKKGYDVTNYNYTGKKVKMFKIII